MLWALLLGSTSLAATPQVESSNRSEYEAARARTGRDPGAHIRLALWCEAHGTPAEVLKHLALAVLNDPGHATARGLLGLVSFRGHWQRPDAVADHARTDPSWPSTTRDATP